MGFIVASTILLFSIWGTFKQYRLLWSDAHFSDDPFIVAVGLNPILCFNETRAFSAIDYNEEIVRDHYQIIANDLGVIQKDIQKLNFTRFKKGRALDKKPNIVIVFLESVGLNRMGRMGNPLDPTPSMDMISKQGIFFFFDSFERNFANLLFTIVYKIIGFSAFLACFKILSI